MCICVRVVVESSVACRWREACCGLQVDISQSVIQREGSGPLGEVISGLYSTAGLSCQPLV